MNKRLINSDHPLLKVLSNHIIDYPTPVNINYAWSFGSLAGIFFALQLATGIFLAMHYTPNVDLAFASVEHIMRDVKNGWLLRYMHSNGASMVFIMIYVHIGKALFYRSYTHKRTHLFFSGVLIFLLMMGTAFIGYVLPWGQMSFWGATVITNLITAVPFVGESIAQWVWGGFSVGNPTLTRFFSLHYLLPFLVTAIILLHLVLLHTAGSSNPLGVNSSQDKISFYPYFFLKDAVGLTLALIFYILLIHFYPNLLGHSDNYIQANPLVTPTHIVPEWYFLPFYAILRAIPNKIGGVAAMLGAILILFLIPFLDRSPIRTPRVRPLFNFFFWLFVADFFLLGFLGGHPAEEPYITASRLASVFYFGFFLVILPLTSHLEPVMAQEMVKEYRIRQEKEAVADRLPAEIRIHAFLKTQEAIEEDLEWLSENFDHLPIRRNRRKHSKKR
jgi:quinol-cytochrome oxidoreductase complex cytochrome b subunit